MFSLRKDSSVVSVRYSCFVIHHPFKVRLVQKLWQLLVRWGLGLVIQIEQVLHVTCETESVLRKKTNKTRPSIYFS